MPMSGGPYPVEAEGGERGADAEGHQVLQSRCRGPARQYAGRIKLVLAMKRLN
jgi:hypothetical protein